MVGFATDKIAHGYLPAYLRLAAEIGVEGRVCEVGVADGGSLLMWQALFPNGLVVGVDDDSYTTRHVTIGGVPEIRVGATWPSGTTKVVAAQDDPGLPERLRAVSPSYDLIVDDASHDGRLTRRTWDLLWPLVAPGGFYVIEDWQVAFRDDWGDDMLTAVQSLLRHLDSPKADVAAIEYRYGLAITRRA